MKNIQVYRDLIAQLEQYHKTHPSLYKLKLALLSLSGLIYILMVLALVFTMSIGLLLAVIFSKNILLLKAVLKFIWIPFILGFFVIKAMWLRFDPPQGYPLTRQQAPELFNLVHEVRAKMQAKRIHQVLLTYDFNAGVYQLPRFGMFGGVRRYLILGLPLLGILSKDELKAVIAHEFGHLANNHMRFANWIYRLRQLWMILLTKLEQSNSVMVALFTRFFAWYSPYFNAYSFVLARTNEYEADRAAATITSNAITAAALTKTYTYGDYIDNRFWQDLYLKISDDALPPRNVYSKLISSSANASLEMIRQDMQMVLQGRTDIHDTHPCLSDRLHNISSEPVLDKIIHNDDSAMMLLGEAGNRLLNDYNLLWYENIKHEWQQRHEYLQGLKEVVADFSTVEDVRSMPGVDLQKYAEAVAELEGSDAAIGLYEILLQREPLNAQYNFIVGQFRLDKQSEDAIVLLKKAAELDAALNEAVAELLYQYYYAKDDISTAQKYYERLLEYNRQRQLAHKERDTITYNSAVEEHDLPDETLAAITEYLRSCGKVSKAWLVRRVLQYFPEYPGYLLVVKIKNFSGSHNRIKQTLADALAELLFENSTIHVIGTKDSRPLFKKIRETANADIL